MKRDLEQGLNGDSWRTVDRASEAASDLGKCLADVSGGAVRRAQAGTLEIEHVMSASKPPRDVVAGRAVFREPGVSEIEDFSAHEEHQPV